MNHNQSMLARFAAFLVWAVVAASVVFWGLRLLVRAPAAPPHSIAVAGAAAATGDLTRLLGAAPVAATAAALAPDAAARFKLHGVMAPKAGPAAPPSGQGVALISVDGKPARAFAIGARLDRDLVLQSVSLRSASIGPAAGGASVKLEIPPLPMPATGKLAALGGLSADAPSALPGAPGFAPVPALPNEGAPAAVQPPAAPAPAVQSPPARPPHSVAPRREPVNSR